MKAIGIIITALLAAAVGFVAGMIFYPGKSADRADDFVEIRRDTVRLRDTVLIDRPVVAERFPAGNLLARAEVVASDTCAATPDSVEVRLPVERVRYAGDRYEAWVSGYRPSLDSLRIYGEDRVVSSVIARGRHARRRWGFGTAAGVAVTSKGIGPGIVVGLTYSF